MREVLPLLAVDACLTAAGQAQARSADGAVPGFRFRVLLPDGYDGGDRRYPVLYVVAGNGEDERSADRTLALAAQATSTGSSSSPRPRCTGGRSTRTSPRRRVSRRPVRLVGAVARHATVNRAGRLSLRVHLGAPRGR